MIRKLCLLCVASFGLTALAQTAVAPAPEFEVASVRPSAMTFGSYFRYLPGGRLSAMSWMKQVIQIAYGMENYQVMGGPAWLVTDRYQIEAKAENPDASKSDVNSMMQTLLADRFKLKFHTESKDFDVYYLVVDKNGPKLTPLAKGEASKCGRDNSFACGMTRPAQMLGSLQHFSGRPVIDKTGITGRYDVLLDFDTYSVSGTPPPDGYDKPSLKDALHDQLGLKLEPHKDAMPVLVVDAIERPTEN